MLCPSFEKLIEYAEGLTPVNRATRVAAHIREGCDDCGAIVIWYRRFKEVIAGDDSTPPPEWALKRVLEAFEREKAGPISGLGDLIAAKAFDSFASAAATGIRHADARSERLLVYRAGPYSIDFQISRASGGSVDVMGQILKEGDDGFDAVRGMALSITGGGPAMRITADEFGQFQLTGIPAAHYRLVVARSHEEIVVSEIPMTLDR